MRIRLLFLSIIALLLLNSCTGKQNTKTTEEINEITTKPFIKKDYEENTAYLHEVLTFLTSESVNGRLTGTPGNELVIDYIKEEFREYGLVSPENLDFEQSYTQKVREIIETPVLELIYPNEDVRSFEFFNDFGLITYKNNSRLEGDLTSDVYLLKPSRPTILNEEVENRIILGTMDSIYAYGSLSEFKEYVRPAFGIIIELTDFDRPGYPYTYIPSAPNIIFETSVNNENGEMIFTVTPSVYEEIEEAVQNGAKVHMSNNSIIEEVSTSNVVGYLLGTNDEYIIISAHLDHVGANGPDSYNPGALDNGSGIAALLEIARYVTLNPNITDKNLVFIAFNGEEEGLFGASYYTENPLFPLDKTKVINLDMIGAKSDVPLQVNYCNDVLALKSDFEYLITQYEFEVTTSDALNSDHSPFCEVGTEAITLINPDLKNGYHSPYDTIDQVDLNELGDIIDIILNYIEE